MVMFRDFTRRGAVALGLTGYVANNEDGSVTVVAEGTEERLKSLIVRMRRGSLLSRVDDIKETWEEPTGEFTGFVIKI